MRMSLIYLLGDELRRELAQLILVPFEPKERVLHRPHLVQVAVGLFGRHALALDKGRIDPAAQLDLARDFAEMIVQRYDTHGVSSFRASSIAAFSSAIASAE